MTLKNRKKVKKFHILKCFLLFGGLGIPKYIAYQFFSNCTFFSIFGHQKPWIQTRNRIGIQPKMLDQDPESMNQIRNTAYDITALLHR